MIIQILHGRIDRQDSVIYREVTKELAYKNVKKYLILLIVKERQVGKKKKKKDKQGNAIWQKLIRNVNAEMLART